MAHVSVESQGSYLRLIPSDISYVWNMGLLMILTSFLQTADPSKQIVLWKTSKLLFWSQKIGLFIYLV